MARRKNSAELLDILKRIHIEEKERNARQIQEERSSVYSAEAGIHENVSKPASRLREFLVSKEPRERPADPGRIRRAFLSLLSGKSGERTGSGLFLKKPPKEEESPLAPSRFGTLRSALPLLAGKKSRSSSSEVKETFEETPSAVGATPAAPVEGITKEAERGEIFPTSPSKHRPAVRGFEEHSLVERSLEKTSTPAQDSAVSRKEPQEIQKILEGHPPGKTEDSRPGPAEEVKASSAGIQKPVEKPLFGSPAQEVGILTRVARRLWGAEISGSLRKRVEIPVLTISLYVVVALGAMLVMSLFLNQGDQVDRERLKILGGEEEFSSEQDQEAFLSSIDILEPNQEAPPPIRNEESPPAQIEPAEDGKSTIPPGGDGVVHTGESNQEGFYVQIQAFVLPGEVPDIVEHLKAIGYRSIWVRPKRDNFFDLLLGPYPDYDLAKEESGNFVNLMKDNPLRGIRGAKWNNPFVYRYKKH